MAPAVVQDVRTHIPDTAAPPPKAVPPLGGVETPAFVSPEYFAIRLRLEKMGGRRSTNWAGEPGNNNTEPPPWPYEAAQIVQVQVVRAEIMVSVNRYDGVEEARCKWKCMRLGADGAHQIPGARIQHAAPIVIGTCPQVRRPNADPILSGEEYAAHCPSATEVQNLHSSLQPQRLTEPLGEPERVRTHLVIEHPGGVVAIRAWELGLGKGWYHAAYRTPIITKVRLPMVWSHMSCTRFQSLPNAALHSCPSGSSLTVCGMTCSIV
jgi:hypothetical protein